MNKRYLTDADRAFVNVLSGWFSWNSTVNLPLRIGSAFYLVLPAGDFDLWNAVPFGTVASFGRFHYFSAIH